MAKGYWYFRLLDDNRVLLGGGRNINEDQEATTELTITENIIVPLENILKEIILPNDNHQIELAWSGVMGFSDNH